jgi:hypothetical protein
MTDHEDPPQEIMQGLAAKEIIDGSSSNTTTSNLRSCFVPSEPLRSTVGPDEVRHGFWEVLHLSK